MPPQPHDPRNRSHDSDEALDPAAQAELEHALSWLPLNEPSAALDERVAQALASGPATLDTPAGASAERAQEQTATPADAPLPFPAPSRWRSGWLTALAAAAVVALLAALGLSLYLNPTNTAPTNPSVAGQDPDTPPPNTLPSPGGDTQTGSGSGAGVVQAGYNFQEQPIDLRWSRDIDAGVLTTDNAQPVRAVRRQDVEQRVWVDRERGVTVQITRPRERLLVVKQPTF